MSLDRPIVIVGVGRSGSTVFHHLFTRHPHVAWLADLEDRWAYKPWINRLVLRGVDLPLLGGAFRHAFDPGESYPFWDSIFPGFTMPHRDLRADDLLPHVQQALLARCATVPTGARQRLLFKVTGWPRVGFFKALFPDVRLIHVSRDGRPVTASMLRMPWWSGWRGPEGWGWGELSAAHRAEWERHDRSFVALGGIQWKILMEAMEEGKRAVAPTEVLELRYEDICRDPIAAYRSAVAFAGLDWTPGFEAAVRAHPFRSENERWRRDLTAGQQAVLESVLAPALERYGFGAVPPTR